MRLTLGQKGLLLVLVPLLFELSLIGLLLKALKDADAELERADFARQVNFHSNRIGKLLINSAASIYLSSQASASLIGDRLLDDRFEHDIGQIPEEFQELKRLFADDTKAQKHLAEIQGNFSVALLYAREAKRFTELGNKQAADRAVNKLTPLTTGISNQMDQLTEHYRQIELNAPRLQDQNRQLLETYLIGGAVLGMAVALLMVIYFNRTLRARLNLLAENARRFGRSEPLLETPADTDEIGQVDQTFRGMVDTIKEADQQRKEFLEMITHDLKSPLASVVNSLNLLNTRNSDEGKMQQEESSSLSEGAELACDRMLLLINELLEAEKLKSGKLELNIEKVPLAYVLESSVSALRGILRHKNTDVSIADTDVEVEADAGRMMQVMTNLLSNAISLSPNGSTIHVTAVTDSSDLVTVSVVDNGPGISATDVEKLFQRFQSMSRSDASDPYRGTGLGLAISKTIVEQHGGTIGFENRSDGINGAVFWFTLKTCNQHHELSR